MKIITRREFGAIALGALAAPLADVPDGAIDCHNHVVGPQSKYPMAPNRTYTPPEADVASLQKLRAELGVPRNVIVQPSFYGFDNSCLLDALAQLGKSARGVAVLRQDISDAELRRLAAAGVTGTRLNLATAGVRDPKVAIDAINAFNPKFAPLGWHIQINTNPPVIDAIAAAVANLKVPVVFDHFGGIEAAAGMSQKGFPALVELVRGGNTYVKLSAPYTSPNSPIGPMSRHLRGH